MPEYDVAVLAMFCTAKPVKPPFVLVNRTWSRSSGVVVPIPTFPPVSKTAELPTSALFTYLARKFVVPGSTKLVVAVDWAVATDESPALAPVARRALSPSVGASR